MTALAFSVISCNEREAKSVISPSLSESLFPEDYDGILAGAPAFNWDRFIPAEL